MFRVCSRSVVPDHVTSRHFAELNPRLRRGRTVQKASLFLVGLGGFLTSGCLTTPDLSEATGTQESNIFIRDVVQRVKCELSDAFYEKVDEREFRWLSTWTAQVSLSLMVNNNAGLAPGVGYTKYHKSAPNFGAGPSTPAPTATWPYNYPLVTQSLTVSVGANVSGQAILTEALTFTVAMDELKRWRKSSDGEACELAAKLGVTGKLGLRQWVDSAFYPAEINQLQAGVHTAANFKAPSVNAPPTSTTASKADKTASQTTPADAIEVAKGWQTYLTAIAAAAKSGIAATDSLKTELPKAKDLIKTRVDAMQPYEPVLAPYLKSRYATVTSDMKAIERSAKQCSSINEKIVLLTSEVNVVIADLTKIKETEQFVENSDPVWNEYTALMAKMKAEIPKDIDPKKANAVSVKNVPQVLELNKCADVLKVVTTQPYELPDHIDPPIDAVDAFRQLRRELRRKRHAGLDATSLEEHWQSEFRICERCANA